MGERSPKCFVPECYNSVGVLFPKSLDARRKWLKALGLECLVPGPKSFVCLDHFGSHGQPNVRKEKICAAAETDHKDIEQTSSVTDQPDVRKKKVCADSDNEHKYIGQTSSSVTVYSRYEKVCRLCMVQSSKVTDSVFNKLDEKYTIVQAITICLHPLQVLPNDSLSKHVCSDCIKSLKRYLQFYQKCIAMDAKQRGTHLSEPQNENWAHSEPSEEYLHEERLSDYEEDKENFEDFGQDHINGQIMKRNPTDSDITEKSLTRKETPAFTKKRQRNRSEEELLREDFEQDHTNGQTMKPKPTDSDITNINVTDKDPTAFIKKRRDMGEAGLLKILEGNEDISLAKLNKSEIKGNITAQSADVTTALSESKSEHHNAVNNDETIKLEDLSNYEEDYVEDIIIEMVEEETPQHTSPVEEIVDISKYPVTIKRVTGSPSKSINSKRKLNDSNNLNARSKMTMLQNNEEIIILPKGISVEVKNSVYSQLGLFKSKLLTYAFNSEYLLADEYLYEFGLMKDNVRRLHCIVKKCPGTANQTRVRPNEFLEDIEVITAHNHKAPDDLEKKRQMFYHILYSKMRRDKNFNFKVLYEQFCKVDPTLLRIMPLRNVIREICRQGPTPSPPWLSSFEEFYELIENDEFNKIHFTDNHAQFYQDRFETDDGAKAVLFGNQDILEEYSYSKLMYVDASFVIESDEFPFQLVTVLVWIDESYYPILYAFVNMRSQEIYKKIFGFLYNNLAPSLRPQEIITDYELNLYYALGETYVDSSIGGSMFYFTQNIYKKICALNLARELELNANFRSIYNMLLMLPLLPVNTILDGLHNIEDQAKELELQHLTHELFVYIHNEWICKVTPELFCVHRLENRINENIVAPFKKLRDLLMLSKHKLVKNPLSSSIIVTVEKLLELEKFLRETYSTSSRRSFTKDLSSTQKKMILKAWNYIENYPTINLNRFFLKVLGYIKCMENQLWIWGFYRYTGKFVSNLIDARNFSIINEDNEESQEQVDHGPIEEVTVLENMDSEEREEVSKVIEEFYVEEDGVIRKVEARGSIRDAYRLAAEVAADQEMIEQHNEEEEEEPAVIMQAVIDENGSYVLQEAPKTTQTRRHLNYLYK